MSEWTAVFLGIIAGATVTMAAIQVGLIVVAGRVARRVERLTDRVERELKPLFGHLDSIGNEASRAAALAATQVERADRLLADLARVAGQTLVGVQDGLVTSVREGRAVMSGFRAAMAALRDIRGRDGRSRRAEDEEALFI